MNGPCQFHCVRTILTSLWYVRGKHDSAETATNNAPHRPLHNNMNWQGLFLITKIISGEPSLGSTFSIYYTSIVITFMSIYLYKISFALWHATECPLAFFCLFLFHSGFFKRFIDNFYPVLLIGILYNFIAFQNLLCF